MLIFLPCHCWMSFRSSGKRRNRNPNYFSSLQSFYFRGPNANVERKYNKMCRFQELIIFQFPSTVFIKDKFDLRLPFSSSCSMVRQYLQWMTCQKWHWWAFVGGSFNWMPNKFVHLWHFDIYSPKHNQIWINRPNQKHMHTHQHIHW